MRVSFTTRAVTPPRKSSGNFDCSRAARPVACLPSSRGGETWRSADPALAEPSLETRMSRLLMPLPPGPPGSGGEHRSGHRPVAGPADKPGCVPVKPVLEGKIHRRVNSVPDRTGPAPARAPVCLRVRGRGLCPWRRMEPLRRGWRDVLPDLPRATGHIFLKPVAGCETLR